LTEKNRETARVAAYEHERKKNRLHKLRSGRRKVDRRGKTTPETNA